MHPDSGNITILGENINTIRPKRYNQPIVPKEQFKVYYNTRARTRKIGKHELEKLKKQYEEELNDPRET